MTLDELISSQFEALYSGCDPAVENNPRKYSLGFYSEGVFYGIKLGTQIGQDVRTEDAKREWERTWALGYAQALNYAVFNIAHVILPLGTDVKTLHGGELMRESIIDLIRAAIESDLIRYHAKIEGERNEAQTKQIAKAGNGKAS